ncbi:MAG: nucleotidyl transferase AbiEii/AbiGii toxin family protein [bacterium]
MNVSLKSLQRQAAQGGFRVEVLEKVCRLRQILTGFGRHPFLKSRLVLKGGTALNLFLFDLPRLSVDIDLNYVGQADREAMLAERPYVEQAVQDVCARESMQVARLPEEHAGGKWRLRYASVFGQQGSLEVDINYLQRILLWPVQRHDAARLAGIQARSVPLLDIHELAAGKLAALFARRASRDLFDAHQLLHQPGLDDQRLRTAFLVYGGMNRKDWRTIRVEDIGFDPTELQNQLVPTLRRQEIGKIGRTNAWAAQLIDECRTALARILPFTELEKRFLDTLLDDGELAPELLTRDNELVERIAQHPGLLWKRHNVRRHRGT